MKKPSLLSWQQWLGSYLCLALLTACPAGGSDRQGPGTGKGDQLGQRCLTIMHSNDHHGNFWPNAKGEGGLLAQSTLVNEIRREAKEKGCATLLLSAGDINMGPPASNFSKAKPDLVGMSYMKFDAMAIGNHEFDVDLPTLQEQQSWVDFSFLSANVVKKSDGTPLFKPYLIKDLQGLKVAMLGLTTTDSPKAGAKFPEDQLLVNDPNATAQQLVDELDASADLVIALAHLGYYKNDPSKGSIALAHAVTGVDLIIDGHSHDLLTQPDRQGTAWIVQAKSDSRYLGRLDLVVSDGQWSVAKYEAIPINLLDSAGQPPVKVILEDLALKNRLQPFKDEIAPLMAEVIGQSLGHFEGDRSIIRKQETNLGNLTTSIMKRAADADVAIIP